MTANNLANKAANTIADQATNADRPAKIHPAFEWLRSEKIPSLNITMEEYRHKKTGAIHYHLNSNNNENVFLVAFRTVPMDSRGVAHILEHTALCGSAKYPVRDPFFMMIRRSLNTFMNAFTSSDWTAYPFASKNRKDFGNLLSVYLDAAFFSRLDELDFAQEGHRLEFSEPDNPASDLEFKGVVFNEMKGAMSSTNSVLWQTLSKHLFPTTTYHYNSGGEPDDIPDLSYEDLKNFYKTHYHPSNAVFMTFGDITAYEHHANFEEQALSRFDRLDIEIAVTDEKRYLSPIKVEEYYAGEDDSENKTHIVMAWLLGKSTQLDDLFEAQLLSAVLLDNSASALLNALETSPLGSSPSPLCGLEDSNREMSFMAGLEGCTEGSTAAVEALIMDTLRKVADDGVPQEQVEAALHQLELDQREISGDSYPYGLQLILAGLSTAMHRGDPVKLMNIDPVLDQFREKIKDHGFIPRLIKKLILDNPHSLTLTMKPDKELAAKKVKAEINRLAEIKSTLSEQQVQEIISRSQALGARQEQEEDPGVLPKVGLDDIPEKITEPVAEVHKLSHNGDLLSCYDQGTNGLVYQQVIIELPKFDAEQFEFLPLFTSCVPELGIGDKDYRAVQTWQSRISGGLSCFSSIRSSVQDEQVSRGVVAYSSKALQANYSDLNQLVQETLFNCRFDEGQRVSEIIDQILARKVSSITGHGHVLALTLASSQMSPSAKLNHQAGGLEGISRIKSMRADIQNPDRLASLLETFAGIHRQLLASPRQHLVIAEQEHKQDVIDQIEHSWEASKSPSRNAVVALAPVRNQVRQAWITATQVNFSAKAYPTVASGHEDYAALNVLGGFLRNGFLHRAIREQGGAYGAGSSQDGNSASFRFFSYRDPRLDGSLNDFDRSLDWVISGQHKPSQLEEAILGVIAAMDKPSSPAGEAKQAFYNNLFGYSLEQRTNYRKRVLDVTTDDLKRVVQTYLDPAKASIGILTNYENLQKSDQKGIETINL